MSIKLIVTLDQGISHFDYRWFVDHICHLKGVNSVEMAVTQMKKDLIDNFKAGKVDEQKMSEM